MTDVETVIAARDIAVAAVTTTAANVDLATQQADRAEVARDAAAAPTAAQIATVDADAGSAFRVQQDARLLNTYGPVGDYGAAYVASASRESLEATVVSYNPASVAQVTTPTDSSWADVDATNLKVTFVCPPSGKVEVTLSACAGCATSQGLRWRLKDSASGAGIASTTIQVVTANSAGAKNATSYTRTMLVSVDGAGAALVPGRVYTFVWQHRANVNTLSAYTEYGGAANDGPAVMRVTPISNRVTQKTVTATVDGAPLWQTWDVDADNLHLVGTVGYGQPAQLGRLAYSSNAGSTWAMLPNLATPSGTSHAWFAGDGEILCLVGVTASTPGKIYKSSGWASNPATATFSVVLTANDLGGTHGVYFANYAGLHQHGPICVVNEYGPKTASEMARYVYITEDYGDTWRTILDLREFIEGQVPGWDGADAHTHGCTYDPWWDVVWVVTGDYDGAGTLPYTLVSFDWRSNNPTWHIVYTRHQFTSVIAMPGCILFGTDQGSSAADGIGNGLLRLRRTHPGRIQAGVPQVLEGAFIYDTTSGITVIGNSSSRNKFNPDAPTLIALGRSSSSAGPTARIVATYDGFTFKELWTATDSGTVGSLGAPVLVGSSITAPYQDADDPYKRSNINLTLT